MAVDTQNKRASALGALLPWMNLHPQPDDNDADTAVQRQQMAWTYAGISAGEAVAAAAGGWIFGRRWFIYPDGRRLYQTEDEARDTLREYLKRKRRRKPKPEKIRAAVEQALSEDIEPIVLADYGLLQQLDLPSIPNIEFNFAPPLIDNTALETVYLRAQDMRAQIARQQALVARRRAKEAEFLALLLA